MVLSQLPLKSSRLLLLLLMLALLPACRSAPTEAGGDPGLPATSVAASPTSGIANTSDPSQPTSAESTPPVANPPATETAPPPSADAFQYGLIQPVATLDDARSPETIRANLQQIAALNSNLVYQIFPEGMTPAEWRAYLDIAQEEELSVLVGPSWVSENPDPADLTPVLAMLDAIGDHPALRGFVYLHEPWEMFTTPEMQAMYSAIKAAHPDVPLAVFWSGELQKISRRDSNGDRAFTDGLCDICIVNLKTFQEDPERGQFQSLERMAASAPIIAAGDPDAELWSSTQVWVPPDGGRRGFRVPSPEEMEELLCVLTAGYPLRGFLWSAWQLDKPNEGTLAGPELTPQREAVGAVYESCVP